MAIDVFKDAVYIDNNERRYQTYVPTPKGMWLNEEQTKAYSEIHHLFNKTRITHMVSVDPEILARLFGYKITAMTYEDYLSKGK